jgi:hypothetical protein
MNAVEQRKALERQQQEKARPRYRGPTLGM